RVVLYHLQEFFAVGSQDRPELFALDLTQGFDRGFLRRVHGHPPFIHFLLFLFLHLVRGIRLFITGLFLRLVLVPGLGLRRLLVKLYGVFRGWASALLGPPVRRVAVQRFLLRFCCSIFHLVQLRPALDFRFGD